MLAVNLHFSEKQEFRTEKYLKFEYNGHIVIFLLICAYSKRNKKSQNFSMSTVEF